MKNKTKLFLILFLSNLILFASLIIATGIYLDLTINHKYNRAADNFKPEPIVTIKEHARCSSFVAVEIKIGQDRGWIIHHGYSLRLKTWNWGDATIYFDRGQY